MTGWMAIAIVAPMAIAAPQTVERDRTAERDQAAVLAAMQASAAGWNAGSLDRFMAVYADDATFVTEQGRVARGRAAIAAVYQPTFKDGGNTRGRLSFEQLAYRALGRDHAVLTARWTLTPVGTGKVETGLTTVVFAKQADGWKIVSDHSS